LALDALAAVTDLRRDLRTAETYFLVFMVLSGQNKIWENGKCFPSR
jgi:hypothetical protein